MSEEYEIKKAERGKFDVLVFDKTSPSYPFDLRIVGHRLSLRKAEELVKKLKAGVKL